MIEGRPATPKGLRRLAFAAVLGALISSCGIDIVSVLDTPPVYISPLVFKGPADPDTLYYGVDVFYRIYAVEADANADRDMLLAKQGLANALPGDAIKNYLLSDSYLKYRRLNVNANTPSLKNTFLQTYSAQFNYDLVSNELFLLLYDGEIQINISDLIPLPKILKRSNNSNFSDEPQAGDADYHANAEDADPATYYVQFFAASYGLDTSLNDLYSDAVSIGIQAIDY
jgi:hypothetical protein